MRGKIITCSAHKKIAKDDRGEFRYNIQLLDGKN
jgi:hypothetical protein